MRELPITDDSSMDRYREQRTGETERVQGTVERKDDDANEREDKKNKAKDAD
jgi:hypothetical protein